MMRPGYVPAIFAVVMAMALVSACDSGGPARVAENGAITVRGKLTGVMAIGGETTGWAIELEKPIEVEGKRLTQIEIDGDTTAWARLEGKAVEAKGKITFRQGVERGRYPVLQVETIREEQP